jgi:starch phosphorylase
MAPVEPLIGAANGFLFAAQTSANVPASDFTLRVLPYHPQAIVPLEARHILWR